MIKLVQEKYMSSS